MNTSAPPTLDPVAALRFRALQSADKPAWLHNEVARRMEQRLDWFKETPQSWVDWEPINGGLATHSNLLARYPAIDTCVIEFNHRRQSQAQQQLSTKGLARFLPVLKNSKLFKRGKQTFSLLTAPDKTQADLVWANMLLHLVPNPSELISAWHQSLRVGGWVMFSCLGPDTSLQLRDLYKQLGWPEPAHEFTDMHDWGDMLVEAGFADPVMDMERITLTYSSPESLMQDLRALGRNFNRTRFNALRGRKWLQDFKSNLNALGRTENNDSKPEQALKIPLTFEIIYGHAFKVAPKIKVSESSAFSAEDMRAMLRANKN